MSKEDEFEVTIKMRVLAKDCAEAEKRAIHYIEDGSCVPRRMFDITLVSLLPPDPIANLPMKVSELKGGIVTYIECSCGATLERACGPAERKFFLEKHKDHNVKRFHQATSKVSS